LLEAKTNLSGCSSRSRSPPPAPPLKRPARRNTHLLEVLDNYTTALKSAPLSRQTRRTYASKVRQFLASLAVAETVSDTLNAKDARDWTVARLPRPSAGVRSSESPRRSTNALATIDDLCIRRLGRRCRVHRGAVHAAGQPAALRALGDAPVAAGLIPRPLRRGWQRAGLSGRRHPCSPPGLEASLYKGDVGVALAIRELDHPERAVHPIFEAASAR
jgi:hypothetical protein